MGIFNPGHRKAFTIDKQSQRAIEQSFTKLGVTYNPRLKRQIARKAAKIVVKTAKREVESLAKDTGTLKKSIKSLTFKRSAAIFVGPKRGGKHDGWYGHFTEDGTAQGITAVHYMKNAYEKTKDQAAKGLIDAAEFVLMRKATQLGIRIS